MIKNPFSLEGKTILITGASSGIGRQTAIEISNAGAARCILVARNVDALAETASKMNKDSEVIIQRCDFGNSKELEILANEMPKLDGIVSNAGINSLKLLQFSSESDIKNIFDINCFAPLSLVRNLLKKKKINQNASIVFTSSISGFTNVSVGNGLYGASKAALTSFMKYLALELAPKGIRCNAVHPGRVETSLLQNGMMNSEDIEKDKLKYPLRRYGRPEEVAYSIIYLLSDAASWITGTSLVIDGGRSLV